MRWRLMMLTTGMLAMIALHPARAHAQFGGFPTEKNSQGWWATLGGGRMTIRDITDGQSGSVWSFGTTGLWMARASVEKAVNQALAIGILGGWGAASLRLRPIEDGMANSLPAACQVECPASARVWVARLKGRTGGGPGIHTTLEGDIGVTGFGSFKTKGDEMPITTIKSAVDVTGIFGAGIGYSLTPDLVVNIIQDAGIGMHSGTNLPAGASRYWKNNTLRMSLRYRFGHSGTEATPP